MSDDLEPRLQQWYRQLPKEQPSAALEEEILQAARQQLKPQAKKQWQVPLAVAASIVVVSSLVLYVPALQQAPKVVLTPTPMPESAPAPAPAPAPEVAVAPTLTNAPPVVVGEVVTAKAKSEAKDEKVAAPTTQVADAKPSSAPMSVEADKTVAAAPVAASPSVSAAPAANRATITWSDRGAAAREESVADSSRMAEQMVSQEAKVTAKKKDMAAAPAVKALAASMMVEGINIGMSRQYLNSLGWSCKGNTCQQVIDQPRQSDYWGLPAAGATLQVLLQGDVVQELLLTQKQASADKIEHILASVGKETTQTCQLNTGGVLRSSRLAGGLILSLWSEQGLVGLSMCATP